MLPSYDFANHFQQKTEFDDSKNVITVITVFLHVYMWLYTSLKKVKGF